MVKKEIMSFQRCKNEFLHIVDADYEKISSFVKMAKLEFNIIKNIPITSETSSKLSKDYYEIIKDLLSALLLSHGYKSSNHECLISFFKEKYPNLDYETGIIYELKNIRNRISYDGFFVSQDYLKRNEKEFLHIISLLERLINDNVPKKGQAD